MKYCFEHVRHEFKKKTMYFIVLLYKLWMDMYDNTSKGLENNTIHYCRFLLNSWFISLTVYLPPLSHTYINVCIHMCVHSCIYKQMTKIRTNTINTYHSFYITNKLSSSKMSLYKDLNLSLFVTDTVCLCIC